MESTRDESQDSLFEEGKTMSHGPNGIESDRDKNRSKSPKYSIKNREHAKRPRHSIKSESKAKKRRLQ